MKIHKAISLVAITTLSLACRKPVENAANELKAQSYAEAKIKAAAASVAYAEHSLSGEKAPGRIALKTEELRDAKAKLSSLIEENSKVLPEAQQLADTHIRLVKSDLVGAEVDALRKESEAYDRIRAMNAKILEDQATGRKR